jgi:hypothetical protein
MILYIFAFISPVKGVLAFDIFSLKKRNEETGE